MGTGHGGRRLLVAGVGGLLAVAAVAAAAAAPDARPPRIVAAAMLDADRDGRADGARLTFSEPVRHPVDRDGRYPVSVTGYRVLSVGAARGKVVDVALVERADGDADARPAVAYRRTRADRVLDRAGNQAAGQTFRRTTGHGVRPAGLPAPDPTPLPDGPLVPTPTDRDGDGALDAADCGPDDPAIRPGARDRPDLAFLDANCDGIDGDAATSIFVSPRGRDDAPGTREAPKRQIAAAIAVATPGQAVLVAAGIYARIELRTGVSVYGGYDPDSWRRGAGATSIAGSTQGVLGQGDTDVTLQLLSVTAEAGSLPGASAYGLRLLQGSQVRLERVTVTAGSGNAGAPGRAGGDGRDGEAGEDGRRGACDREVSAPGGAGGKRPDFLNGGDGGAGRYARSGLPGTDGVGGGLGGAGGKAGDPGLAGTDGERGTGGRSGSGGPGGGREPVPNTAGWQGQRGADGGLALPGLPGGGGGGGGGQTGVVVIDGTGNGGGGGGAGGDAGRSGSGGSPGGGSFGVYLQDSTVVVLDGSSIAAGSGGLGGEGGPGGLGGSGGAGGEGATECSGFVGAGGDGGNGGRGGRGGGGGGGAGGPSVGIYRGGTSTAEVSADSTVANGLPGSGGLGGFGGGETANGRRGAIGLAAPIHPA